MQLTTKIPHGRRRGREAWESAGMNTAKALVTIERYYWIRCISSGRYVCVNADGQLELCRGKKRAHQFAADLLEWTTPFAQMEFESEFAELPIPCRELDFPRMHELIRYCQ